ncbi:MAG: alpha/beta hydrolase [Halanaerobiales bacterium]|nr:alpha/beta hydrolase [Halanaerobiales bacterium]
MKKRKVLLILIIIMVIFSIGLIYFINSSYKPLENNENYLKNEYVVEHDKYYEFKHNNSYDKAFIFYPGGRVDERAYAPLAYLLSERGYPVYLVKMPLDLAVLDIDRAQIIIDQYNKKIQEWYLIGHSLGGAMAGSYIYNNFDNLTSVKGLILLASYVSEETNLSDQAIDVLSITATEDKILNWEKYVSSKNNLPSDTVYNSIEGGNHSGFGNYGPQKGDGQSLISKQKQWEKTVHLIIEFIN